MSCHVIENAAGLRVSINANGSLSRIDHDDIMLNLFRGNVMEGGPTNLYLRRLRDHPAATVLLGPRSPSQCEDDAAGYTLRGTWESIEYRVSLRLAAHTPVWFWHVSLVNRGPTTVTLDLIHAQDLGLAHYGFIRTNEYFTSQYLDHTPLLDARVGHVLATRQNQAMGGRNPWCLLASLTGAVSYATDALQFHGLATRAGAAPRALSDGLPGLRLQHEHALVALQDAPLTLAPGQSASRGFVGCFAVHHPQISSADDLAALAQALALPEASAPALPSIPSPMHPLPISLFSHAPLFPSEARPLQEFAAHYGPPVLRETRDGIEVASFHQHQVHLVSRAKECVVQRAHAQILRSGTALVPDEAALTTTTWMGGIFNSLLTQGHVGINRLLSSSRAYLGLFRALGQRVFIERDGQWLLLDEPSAWASTPRECHWFYTDAMQSVQVTTRAQREAHVIDLEIRVLRGPPARLLIAHHVALDDDDGADAGPVNITREGAELVLRAHPSSAVGARFGTRGFRLRVLPGTVLEHSGGDECLFLDGVSRAAPYICLVLAATREAQLQITGELIDAQPIAASLALGPHDLGTEFALSAPAASPHALAIARWSAILPWFADNALVHYLAPRGLEQFTGGGWGTRDICQGPLEMLLALGHLAPARDLLLRVFGTQNSGGDWPQWFTFFARDRGMRASDAHGDIVFWPLLGLARYLEVSGDLALLDSSLAFHHDGATNGAEVVTVWQHVERAIQYIDAHCLPGTALISYGHGDWNDSMQPADPKLREELCSSWTVTLHYQMLITLAVALAAGGRDAEAADLRATAMRVAADFQRWLVIDDVVPGYMHWRDGDAQDYLLHPRDVSTGLRYSLLPMPHAVLSGILSPAQAAHHFTLIEQHLLGPDGARLFDQPMRYRGGTMTLFQRAESAAFFGREIGLMYTHAHLRYAEALAMVGRGEEFFAALNLVNPIDLAARLPGATARQSNCYYSSSDAAFADRYAAYDDYARVARGEIEFDGGWRVYSSGPGLAIAILVRSLFGLRAAGAELHIDPVMPTGLDGLCVSLDVVGKASRFSYHVGERGFGVEKVTLNGLVLQGRALSNPYRQAGVAIAMQAIREALRETGNEWEIAVS